MRDDVRLDRSGAEAPETADLAPAADPPDLGENDDGDPFEESLTDELAALIDDGRTYAEAEIAFQKTRASLAGRKIGKIVGFALLALIVLNIALIALAIGMLIALTPLVTIWGATAIVVGVLLMVVGGLVLAAKANADRIGALFEDQAP